VVEASPAAVYTEPSQGTHFLNSITSLGVGYFVVPPAEPGAATSSFVDWAWLDAQPAQHESRYLRHLRLDQPVVATVDGRRGVGTIASRQPAQEPDYDYLFGRR